MYLGLDLRGGVHFLMQVDLALDKKSETRHGHANAAAEKSLHAWSNATATP